VVKARVAPGTDSPGQRHRSTPSIGRTKIRNSYGQAAESTWPISRQLKRPGMKICEKCSSRLAIRTFPFPLKTAYAVFKKDGGKLLLPLPRDDSTRKQHLHAARLPASPEPCHSRTNPVGAVTRFRSAQLCRITVKSDGLGLVRRMGNGRQRCSIIEHPGSG